MGIKSFKILAGEQIFGFRGRSKKSLFVAYSQQDAYQEGMLIWAGRQSYGSYFKQVYSLIRLDSTASPYTNNNIFSFLVQSSIVKLETTCTAILTTTWAFCALSYFERNINVVLNPIFQRKDIKTVELKILQKYLTSFKLHQTWSHLFAY